MTEEIHYSVWFLKSMKDFHPAICEFGDGFIDWHIPPLTWAPAGRYRIVMMDGSRLLGEWEGEIPDDSREAVVFVEGGIAPRPRLLGAGPHLRSHLGS